MSEHFVYVDRFQIREGRLADFKRYATEMAELVEENEPDSASASASMLRSVSSRW